MVLEIIKNNIFLLVFLLVGLFCGSIASAASLSVTPLDGGNTINFGRINASIVFDKEVKIRVNGFEGSQYQVYQRIVQPLVNEKGQPYNRSALVTKGLESSNATGTLHINVYEPLKEYDQLIYTSNSAGSSDSFRMLYSIQNPNNDISGIFNAQIVYIVRSVGNNQRQEASLNVYMEVMAQFNVSVNTSDGKNLIQLNSEHSEDDEFVKIVYEGFSGNTLRINQEVIMIPMNAEGKELNLEGIEFYVMSEKGGQSYYNSLTEIKRGATDIYKSESSKDEVTVYFKLKESALSQQISGHYHGKLRYSIGEVGRNLKIIDVDFDVDIAPIFKLKVEYPPEGMAFSKILPDMPPQERTVKVQVKTNLGRPYVVTQDIKMDLQNENGEAIEKDYFLIKQEKIGETGGTVTYVDYTPVSVNDSTLYVSDKQGSPAEFTVTYQLKPYQTIKAGNYQTVIIYSLGER